MIAIDLSGKTAIITGASQGLGLATVKKLHQAGASLVVNYFPDTESQQQKQAHAIIEILGCRAIAFPADIRKMEDCEAMVQAAIDQFGSIDLLVNNAGILRDKTMKKMQLDEWQAVIDTNLTGVFQMCKAAGEKMCDGGRIVNLASISAVLGFFGQSNYVAAKAGVIGLTKVLSRELARRKINVNAVAPGVVLTEMGKSIPESSRTEMLSQIPLARFGEPDEIADCILFLCSQLASYITGQTLHVNGGWIG